jgi:hypothetical protein
VWGIGFCTRYLLVGRPACLSSGLSVAGLSVIPSESEGPGFVLALLVRPTNTQVPRFARDNNF